VALSGGAFTLAALVYVFHMYDLHPATRPTVLFGLLGYSAVLVILFFDLGRWDRFWHFLVYPNVNSALFEVSWCIALYSLMLIYEFSPAMLENRGRPRLKFIKKYAIVLVIVGVAVVITVI
jgi:molybdopterin-containing oxidoreductase family membrane subunit